MVESSKMKLVVSVSWFGKTGNTYKILVGIVQYKRPLCNLDVCRKVTIKCFSKLFPPHHLKIAECLVDHLMIFVPVE
jgi:hypothetical protein